MAVEAYKVVTGLGDLKEGDILHVDAEKALKLVEAGILEPASEEDVNGGGEEVETQEAPELVQNAAKALSDKVTEAVEKATAKVAEKLNRTVPAPVIPARGLHVAGSDEGKTWGFKSLGDFIRTTIDKGTGEAVAVKRFDAAQKSYTRFKDAYSTNGGPSITATDGGVLIPPAYASELFEKPVEGQADLFSMCTEYPYNHTTQIPVNNKGSYNAGIRSYWVSEYAQATQTVPVLDMVDMKANTLVTLVPVTDQLIQETPYNIETFIKQEAPEQMLYRKNANVLYGNGSGANVLSHATTIVVTRTTANRILFADLNNMYARAANPSKSYWFVSPSYFPELQRLAFPDASGSIPVFVPNPTGYPNIAGPVPGTLHGRPVVLCDMMQALGAKGDIMFGDLSSVALIERNMGDAVSPHFYFDRLSSLFRFAIRAQTVSQWKSVWTRVDGVTCGPCVVLSGTSGTPTAPTFS